MNTHGIGLTVTWCDVVLVLSKPKAQMLGAVASNWPSRVSAWRIGNPTGGSRKVGGSRGALDRQQVWTFRPDRAGPGRRPAPQKQPPRPCQEGKLCLVASAHLITQGYCQGMAAAETCVAWLGVGLRSPQVEAGVVHFGVGGERVDPVGKWPRLWLAARGNRPGNQAIGPRGSVQTGCCSAQGNDPRLPPGNGAGLGPRSGGSGPGPRSRYARRGA
jgi:hypothetical protein